MIRGPASVLNLRRGHNEVTGGAAPREDPSARPADALPVAGERDVLVLRWQLLVHAVDELSLLPQERLVTPLGLDGEQVIE